ncbi:MAG: hypothetical protein HXY49_01115 [Ignavibacteriaceae bacterium]|nr:hypothetical protein [Ignavibacteriaceae bacterium]
MKTSIKHIIRIQILFLLIVASASAQEYFSSDSADVDYDTTSAFVMQKSPWTSVLFSAVLPGAGQIYNESYLKAPVIWTITGLLVYGWIVNNDNYIYYRDLYEKTPAKVYKDLRYFYQDQRDELAIYIALVYFLNLVDAYVDAHLFDFNVDENTITGTPEFGIKIRF